MFEKLRNELQEKMGLDLSRLTLAKRFSHMTKGGDGVYFLWLLYWNGERLADYSFILSKLKINGISQNSKGYIIGRYQVQDYIAYYVPEIKQMDI